MTWKINIKGDKYIAEVISDDLSHAIFKADEWRSQGAEVSIITKFSMPGHGGIYAIEHIRKLNAHARVLVIPFQGSRPHAATRLRLRAGQ